jgi:hypothetical protein
MEWLVGCLLACGVDSVRESLSPTCHAQAPIENGGEALYGTTGGTFPCLGHLSHLNLDGSTHQPGKEAADIPTIALLTTNLDASQSI